MKTGQTFEQIVSLRRYRIIAYLYLFFTAFCDNVGRKIRYRNAMENKINQNNQPKLLFSYALAIIISITYCRYMSLL